MKSLFRSILPALAALILWAGICPALSSPSWEDVPPPLRKGPGAQRAAGYLFATGVCKVKVIGGRKDKAHELAEKKSLARAMQEICIASSCARLTQGLTPRDRQRLVQILSPVFPDLRVRGLTVIRQWRDRDLHLTTVAVPVAEIRDLPCPFKDLSDAISRYLGSNQNDVEGLSFCLGHTERYSKKEREIRRRIARLYNSGGMDLLARPFKTEPVSAIRFTSLDRLAVRYRFSQAKRLSKKAEGLAAQGNWKDALAAANKAVKFDPDHPGVFLVLGDYFLKGRKEPALALAAYEKALRTGTVFNRPVEGIVECLYQMKSEEAEVWEYVLSKGVKGDMAGYPSEWQEEMQVLSGAQVSSLVIASLGQVVEGESGPPDQAFRQAVELFGQAKSDDDLLRVLAILISAAEKAPSSAQTWNLIGACYRNLDRPFMALPFLWQAVKLRPGYDLALTNLGLCCQSLGLMKSAGYYFRQEAVRKSNNSWVRESYARFVRGEIRKWR